MRWLITVVALAADAALLAGRPWPARPRLPAAPRMGPPSNGERIVSLEKAVRDLETAGCAEETLSPLRSELQELKLAELEAQISALNASAPTPAVAARLPFEATQATPDAGQKRLPLSPDKPDPRSKVPGARELPVCTVVVAGANGRVGSKVVTELLRKHPRVSVRALVRSATRIESYEKLSFESGAEDGRMSIRPAWEIGEGGGFLAGQTSEFDGDVQGDYGLDRLELVECELRHRPDVARAVAGADAVIYCASTFGESRARLPEQLDNWNQRVAAVGADLFELRLPGFGRSSGDEDEAAARRSSAAGKTADEEGVQLAVEELGRELARRSRLAALTGSTAAAGGGAGSPPVPTPFVLASACAALGYSDSAFDGELQETEFGYRKRMGEAAARGSGFDHLIVRAAALDEARVEEGLQVESVEGVVAEQLAAAEAEPTAGVRQDELRKNKIHPRDVARVLVASLFGVEGGVEPEEGQPRSHTFEVWSAENVGFFG